VAAAFTGPLRAVDVRLVAVDPRPGRGVVAGLLTDLGRAARAAADRGDALLVGGVSLGAHLAVRWAAEHPGAVGGLLLALPAWTGDPAGAPAALAARHSAARVRAVGTAGALAEVAATAPRWLAEELARAWSGYGAELASSLEAAAAAPGPTPAELGRPTAPAGLAAVPGDAVHPVAVAREWREHLPRAALVTAGPAAFAADPAVLGRAAVLAWLRARSPAG
jgi:pimeloyl-ACP methyl ester carboxylesterase